MFLPVSQQGAAIITSTLPRECRSTRGSVSVLAEPLLSCRSGGRGAGPVREPGVHKGQECRGGWGYRTGPETVPVGGGLSLIFFCRDANGNGNAVKYRHGITDVIDPKEASKKSMMSERDLCPPGMDRVDGGGDGGADPDPDSLRRAHDTTTVPGLAP